MTDRGGWSRRGLLRAMGASTAALPLLPMFESEAADGGPPCRLILVTSCNGTMLEDWRPTGGETDFELGSILQPLAPFRDDLIIVDGLDNLAYYTGINVAGHFAMGTLWSGMELLAGDDFIDDTGAPSGWGGGITVDQRIAEAIGGETPMRSLELGVQVGWHDVRARAHYLGAGQPLPAREDPALLFDELFADLMLDPEAQDNLRAARLGVLDAAKDELDALRGRVGAADRQRMDAHAEALNSIAERVDTLSDPVGCELPGQPPAVDPSANDNFPEVAALQTDLLVRALACDLTRVASLQFGTERHGPAFTWLGSSAEHHTVSHETQGGDAQMMTDINTWFSEQFANLLGALQTTPDADGNPLFDRTIVVWACPLGTGRTHSARNVPVVIAHGAGGPFNTGRALKFGTHDPYGNAHGDHGGEPMNKLLVSLCQAFGLDNVNTFGSTAADPGPLPGLV